MSSGRNIEHHISPTQTRNARRKQPEHRHKDKSQNYSTAVRLR